jgi:hypothetical protein
MHFIIAGRIRGRKRKIIKKLESWPLKEGEKFEIPRTDLHSSEAISIRRKDASNITFGFSLVTPRHLEPNEVFAMSCLNHILNGTTNSKIFGLARKRGLVYGMGSSVASNSHHSYWDFDGETPFTSKGGIQQHTLSPVGNISLRDDGIVSGKSLYLDGKSYLFIPYKKTGTLNVKTNQVTVLAWVKKDNNSKIGFVAGMWNEYQDGGKRQYGLFVSLPHYNGADQVCGHISKTGGPTPPFKYSIDYSASAQKVPFDEWVLVGFTYDGTYIRSYFNGEFKARNPELIKHYKGKTGVSQGIGTIEKSLLFSRWYWR